MCLISLLKRLQRLMSVLTGSTNWNYQRKSNVKFEVTQRNYMQENNDIFMNYRLSCNPIGCLSGVVKAGLSAESVLLLRSEHANHMYYIHRR